MFMFVSLYIVNYKCKKHANNIVKQGTFDTFYCNSIVITIYKRSTYFTIYFIKLLFKFVVYLYIDVDLKKKKQRNNRITYTIFK